MYIQVEYVTGKTGVFGPFTSSEWFQQALVALAKNPTVIKAILANQTSISNA